MKSSCIIIEDGQDTLKILKEYILQSRQLELKAEFNNVENSLGFLRNPVDLIFLNIDLPETDRLLASGILATGQGMIFIKESGNKIVNNFPFTLVDYLSKPLSYIKFTEAVQNIFFLEGQQSLKVSTDANHLFTRSGGQMVRICLKDILYIRGAKEYVSLHFKDKRLLVYKRMKDMETLLPSNFIRVHLSYIINIDHVQLVANKHLMVDTEKIPVGNTYRSGFKHYIGQRAF